MNKQSWRDYLYRLVHSEERTILAQAILLGLYILSRMYSCLLDVKLRLFQIGIFKQHKLMAKVISIGNITLGGTGKTPTAERIAKLLQEMAVSVTVLNRGYMADYQEEVGLVSDGARIFMNARLAGDEAYLLAKNLPGVSVVIGRERVKTGQYSIEYLGSQALVLDDGYQHWQLHRDLNILLIDGVAGFGNHYVLPRGTLRESLHNLNRADVILLTKVNQTSEKQIDSLQQELRLYNKTAIIVHCVHKPRGFIPIHQWYKSAFNYNNGYEQLLNKNVLAVSGIGNPQSFEQTLREMGVNVVRHLQFPDHHAYSMAEMKSVLTAAAKSHAEAVILTEKDAVKIPVEILRRKWQLPTYVLHIEVEFIEGFKQLRAMIRGLWEKD